MKIFSIFKKGLAKTKTKLFRSFETLFTDVKKWDEETYKNLEKSLLSADLGLKVTKILVKEIKERYDMGQIKTSEDIFHIASSTIQTILDNDNQKFEKNKEGTTVILMVGVNGSGKTTTTGKLAHYLKNQGNSVLLAACDTFRAAAVKQLQLWGEKTNIEVIAKGQGADPAAVAYEATTKALNNNTDFLIIDTAGRQHTRQDLMQELQKIHRVINKKLGQDPSYTWLVVDGSTGTNALNQAKLFRESCNINGLCVTKLDGTGKGGVIVAIKEEQQLPIYFVGLGEQLDDLQEFNPEWYSKAIFDQ